MPKRNHQLNSPRSIICNRKEYAISTHGAQPIDDSIGAFDPLIFVELLRQLISYSFDGIIKTSFDGLLY